MPNPEAPDDTYRSYEEVSSAPSPALRRAAHWVVLVAAAIFGGAFFFGGAYSMLYSLVVFQVGMNHFSAAIGLPSAALASLCIAIVLEGTAGPIQLEGMGFKFKGAAGPIVFWIFCFLAITFAIHLLW